MTNGRFTWVDPPVDTHGLAFRKRAGWPLKARAFSIRSLRLWLGWARMPRGSVSFFLTQGADGRLDAEINIGRLRLWAEWRPRGSY